MNKSILMSQVSKTSKALNRAKRRTKPIQMLSGMVMSNSLWSRILRTLLKDFNLSSEDISILNNMKLWMNAKSG